MKKENKGTAPTKVGHLKYLRLPKKELVEKHTIDDYFAFRKKYQPSALLYFLYCLPQRISNKVDRFCVLLLGMSWIGRRANGFGRNTANARRF